MRMMDLIRFAGTQHAALVPPGWNARTSAADNQWFSVAFAPSIPRFAAVAASGTGDRVMTSDDGVTWVPRTSAADNQWRSVCWSPDVPLFAACGLTGTGNRLMTSPDGITWTPRTSTADNSWVGICWSSSLTLFCAIGQSVNRAMTSPTGVTWTQRTTASSGAWQSVCAADTLTNKFISVGTDICQTSIDGSAWVLRTIGTGAWRSVCFSPQLGLLVAVSTVGTATTSLDGETWTTPAAMPTTANVGVIWCAGMGGGTGMFAAISSDATNAVSVSPDGVNWTRQTTPLPSTTWRGLAWAPALKRIVAVASAGTAGSFAMSAP